MMRILLVPVLVATFAAPAAAQLEGAFTLGRLKELLKESPSAEQLIRMRSHGDFGSR